MEYNKFKLEIEMTGLTGKKAAEALGELFGKEVSFDRESDKYSVHDEINRTWTVGKADNITCQKLNGDKIINANPFYSAKLITPQLTGRDMDTLTDIANRLDTADGLTNESTKLSVIFETSNHTDKSIENLKNLFESKGDLIYKAIGSGSKEPPIVEEADNKKIVKFPMFGSSLEPERIQSYVQLASSLNSMAISQKNISPKKTDAPNEKYAFRTFMLRLGMIGDDFKNARSILMENLEGNPSWKNQETADRHKQKLKANPVNPVDAIAPEMIENTGATINTNAEILDFKQPDGLDEVMDIKQPDDMGETDETEEAELTSSKEAGQTEEQTPPDEEIEQEGDQEEAQGFHITM